MKNMLTPKQSMFVEEYLVDLNATQAAIRSGYSKKTARQVGSQNLSKPNIQAAITKAMDERSKRTGITADRVLKEIASMSFADIREIFTKSGQLRAVHSMPDRISAAVQSVEVVVRPTGELDDDGNREVAHVHKIRLADKLKGLEMLCKHLGLFNDNSSLTPGGVHITMNYGPPEGREISQGKTIEGEQACS